MCQMGHLNIAGKDINNILISVIICEFQNLKANEDKKGHSELPGFLLGNEMQVLIYTWNT